MFVMSRCPDANACEALYSGVISQVGTIVDLHVNYIASETSPGSFVCMHGKQECTGNMQQLCAYNYYGGFNYSWWDFIQCQDETQYNIPNNAETCAQTAGVSYPLINDCVTSSLGTNLFSQSLKFTQSLGIKVSCTMNIASQYYCTHDSGTWINCTSSDVPTITSHICDLYQGAQKPVACLNQ
uniref:Uncharacterized protein n=1 Tax=Arcella intermedia TaxID=1963864 RepID=A0A6B2LKE5_9EUKA